MHTSQRELSHPADLLHHLAASSEGGRKSKSIYNTDKYVLSYRPFIPHAHKECKNVWVMHVTKTACGKCAYVCVRESEQEKAKETAARESEFHKHECNGAKMQSI